MSPQAFPHRIRFSWESGNSWEGAAVETHISPLPPSPSRPRLFFSGKETRVGTGRSLGLTGDVDLDRDFSPAHLVLRPACHILSVEVAGHVGQGQPQRRPIPRLLGQEKEGKIKKSIRWLLARGWGLELMPSGTPLWLQMEKRGVWQGGGGKRYGRESCRKWASSFRACSDSLLDCLF